MGSGGSKFESGDVFVEDRAIRKTLTLDTGTNLTLLTSGSVSNPCYPGQLVFCTSSGGVFTAGRLYQRDESNTTWLEVVFATAGQTVAGRTISDASNTISNIGSSSISAGALTAVKLVSSITKFASVTSSTVKTTTSTSYTDLDTGIFDLTITANGGRAGLLCEYVSNAECSSSGTASMAITDGSGNIKAATLAQAQVDGVNKPIPFSVLDVEAAPSSGSVRRKVMFKTNNAAVTVRNNNDAVTNGRAFYIMEVI